MEPQEITIEIDLEDGIHEVRIIGSQIAIDVIISALEGDATEVGAIEVLEVAADEAADEEA